MRICRPLSLFALIAGTLLGRSPAEFALLLDAQRAGDSIIAVGERGLILRSRDEGVSWETVPSGVESALTCVGMISATEGWAGGHDGTILRTTDGGGSWAPTPRSGLEKTDTVLSLAADARGVVMVGAFGLATATRKPALGMFARLNTGDDVHWNAVAPTVDGFLAVGEGGAFLDITSAGETRQRQVADAGSLHGILQIDERTWLAFGLGGRVIRSIDGLNTWARVPANVSGLLAAGVKLADGTLVLAGQAGVWLVSTDSGASFHARPSPAAMAISRLLPLKDGQLLILGDGGARRVAPGGNHR